MKIIQKIINNPKTSIAGITLILASLLPLFNVPATTITAICSAIGGIGLLLAKDNDVTGGTSAQTTEAQKRIDNSLNPVIPVPLSDSNIEKNSLNR